MPVDIAVDIFWCLFYRVIAVDIFLENEFLNKIKFLFTKNMSTANARQNKHKKNVYRNYHQTTRRKGRCKRYKNMSSVNVYLVLRAKQQYSQCVQLAVHRRIRHLISLLVLNAQPLFSEILVPVGAK